MCCDATPGTMGITDLDVMGQCACHIWIIRNPDRPLSDMRCKRCARPIHYVRTALPEDKTQCLHTGACDPWKDIPSATSTGPGTA